LCIWLPFPLLASRHINISSPPAPLKNFGYVQLFFCRAAIFSTRSTDLYALLNLPCPVASRGARGRTGRTQAHYYCSGNSRKSHFLFLPRFVINRSSVAPLLWLLPSWQHVTVIVNSSSFLRSASSLLRWAWTYNLTGPHSCFAFTAIHAFKSSSFISDRKRVRPLFSLIAGVIMLNRARRRAIPIKPEIYVLSWYPSSRSCASPASGRPKSRQLPPLMVRKPEWRR